MPGALLFSTMALSRNSPYEMRTVGEAEKVGSYRRILANCFTPTGKRSSTFPQERRRVKLYCDPAVEIEHYTQPPLLSGYEIINIALPSRAAHLPTHDALAEPRNRYHQLPPKRLGKRDRHRPVTSVDYSTRHGPSVATHDP